VADVTRWDTVGTTSGPTRIGDIVVPAGAELFIAVAEPGDMEDCEACRLLREGDPAALVDEAERFRLHLERHWTPQARYRSEPS
jgi:hypothetical protein